jgi:hypothetical protein
MIICRSRFAIQDNGYLACREMLPHFPVFLFHQNFILVNFKFNIGCLPDQI